MNKKLPNIYANRIDKKLNNNNTVSVTKEEKLEEQVVEPLYGKNINQKIREIFNSPKYVYKADVVIKLKDKTITKKIIGKNNNNLITIDNELIPIIDIIDIYYHDK